MFFIGSFREGSSGLQPRCPSSARAVGPRWFPELGRTWGRRAGGGTWVGRNVLLCVLQKWNFPFVENSTSLILFYFFLIQRNILDMRNFLWTGNSHYRTCQKESVQFFQQTGGRAGKRAWFSWIPLQSSVHWATQPLQDFCLDEPTFPTELQTWAKGEVTTLLFFFFFFNFSFRSRDPRAVSGLASGKAILIPLKILVLPVGSFVQHFPSQLVLWGWTFSRCWLCGKKEKEGPISSSLDLPGEWFSSRDPNLKPLLPSPPRSSLQPLTYAGMDCESVSTNRAGQVLREETDWHFGSRY